MKSTTPHSKHRFQANLIIDALESEISQTLINKLINKIKTRGLALLILFSLITFWQVPLRAQSCDGGGCYNLNKQYPSGTFSTTSGSWEVISSTINGGNWFNCYGTQEAKYDITTCSDYGGSQGWNAEITVFDLNGNVLCYQNNSNRANCPNAPYLRFQAPYTGIYKVLISASTSQNCQNNTGSPYAKVVWRQYQAAPGCSGWVTNPSSKSFGPSGGSGTFNVSTTVGGCNFSASSNKSWVNSITYPGNGNVSYIVDSYTGTSERSATITIKDASSNTVATYTVYQSGLSCSYSLSSYSGTFNSSGGSGSFTINTSQNCDWDADEDVSWLSITSGSSGTGPSTLTFSVSSYTGTSTRTAEITVEDQTYIVTQTGVAACNYTISPSSGSFNSIGGNGNISVNTGSVCPWTASESSSWISITSGSSGTGSGTITFSVSQNSSTSSRTDEIIVSGQTYTVTQSGATSCNYTISPSSVSFNSAGGNGNISVNTGSVCPWTASESSSWISITSGSSGTGPGTVTFSVSQNTSTSSRTDEIIVSGQTYTITQSGVTACNYIITPSSGFFSSSSGSGSFTINTTSACPWNASSGASWVTITAGSSGTGNGTVSFSVSANFSTSSRTTQITVVGQIFTITQSGNSSQVSCNVPRPYNPRGSMIGMPTKPHFEWDKIPGSNITYDIEVMNGSGSIVISGNNILGTRYEATTDLNYSQQYTWKVRARINGIPGSWSETIPFTTYAQPPSSGLGAFFGHYNNTIAYVAYNLNTCQSCASSSCSTNNCCNCSTGLKTGLKWQCVECINRYYWVSYALNLIGGGLGRNAHTYYSDAEAVGLKRFAQGSTNKPVEGDILIWSNGNDLGHVAIVRSVTGNSISVLHQNTPQWTQSFTMTQNNVGGWFIPQYGSRNCLGWIRANPKITYPADGTVIYTKTPTFIWDAKPNPRHNLIIDQKDGNGCYQPYLNIPNIYTNQYTLAQALQAGKDYRYRLESRIYQSSTVVSGTVSSKYVYFSVDPNAQRIEENNDTSTQNIQFFTYRAYTVPEIPAGNVRIYAQLDSNWQDIGYTDANGNLFASNLYPDISAGDTIFYTAPGYMEEYSVITADMITTGKVNIPIFYLQDPYIICNPSIKVWENGQELSSPFVTQPNIQIRVTAENHTEYHTAILSEIDDQTSWNSFDASNDLLNVNLSEGTNPITIRYTNPFDTLLYTTIINYIPLDSLQMQTYNVVITGKDVNEDAAMYINGNLIKGLGKAPEQITVPVGANAFAFTKEGYPTYLITTFEADTIEIPWSNIITGYHNSIRENSSTFQIIPNPSDGRFDIRFKDVLKNECQGIITGMSANIVSQFNLQPGNSTYNFHAKVSKGTYLITISDKEGMNSTVKLIVQ